MKPILLSLALVATGAFAQTVTSPNGNLVVDFTMDQGMPAYSVAYRGVTFLEPSALGLKTNIGDFTKDLELIKVSDQKEITGQYSLPNIKDSDVEFTANTRTFTLGKEGKPVLDVIFNVKDNDLAYKYRVLPQGETKSAVVEWEASGFSFPEATTTFLCPQSDPMVGFARTMPSYETPYTMDAPMGTNGWGHGFTFPCLFKNGENGWILISESGVDGSYCGSHLENRGGNAYGIAFPNPGELNGNGTSGAGITLPGETPWRTVSLGESMAPIAETTVMFDFLAPKYPASKKYDYGKGTWSWIMRMDPSCNFDEQKEYIDFAADMGYETVLVDALWDTQIGYDKVEELAKYGKSKGVDLYLWYNSNGYWNDAPQGPRGKMDRSHIRRQEMAWMQKNGIRGIKVDFFGGDKQQMMQLYEDILSDANDYGILVIFHGCTLPRGWEKMYPNYASSEAVLASENLYFGQGACDAQAFNATLHPIIRNTVGSMDFGGCALNKYWNRDNEPGKGSKRMTSDVFELATAVLFQSPVQHFALAPNNLTDAPAWAIDFMKNVPTTWNEVKYIDGYPGKYLIMARRHGDQWYVAGVNAQDEPFKAKVALPMFEPGQKVTMYADDKDSVGSVKEVKVNKKGEIEIMMPKNGGVVIM